MSHAHVFTKQEIRIPRKLCHPDTAIKPLLSENYSIIGTISVTDSSLEFFHVEDIGLGNYVHTIIFNKRMHFFCCLRSPTCHICCNPILVKTFQMAIPLGLDFNPVPFLYH